jgi:hypothetical protein
MVGIGTGIKSRRPGRALKLQAGSMSLIVQWRQAEQDGLNTLVLKAVAAGERKQEEWEAKAKNRQLCNRQIQRAPQTRHAREAICKDCN